MLSPSLDHCHGRQAFQSFAIECAWPRNKRRINRILIARNTPSAISHLPTGHTERWESGLIQRFAKPSYWETGTEGSNPSLSAIPAFVFSCPLRNAFPFRSLLISRSDSDVAPRVRGPEAGTGDGTRDRARAPQRSVWQLSARRRRCSGCSIIGTLLAH